jgi:hypothetical protein
MKKFYTLSLVILFLTSATVCAQKSDRLGDISSKLILPDYMNPENYNMPPGFHVNPKANLAADYWHKLDQLPTTTPSTIEEGNFLKFITQRQLQLLEVENPPLYNYYVTARNYHEQLSNKVKVTFTYDELWDVYMFNAELKDHLLTIQ